MNELEYNGEKIQYYLKKSKIKNIYIQIKEGKVIVKAPLKIKDEYIKEVLKKKSKWIYEKIKQNKEQKQEKEIKQEDIYNLEQIVKESIKKYQEKLNLIPNKVRIKDIKYAWGSCTSNKNITINLKLATKPKKVIEYVVLHEMCHLKYMNHSKNFWNLVESNMHEYKEYKKILNK